MHIKTCFYEREIIDATLKVKKKKDFKWKKKANKVVYICLDYKSQIHETKTKQEMN